MWMGLGSGEGGGCRAGGGWWCAVALVDGGEWLGVACNGGARSRNGADLYDDSPVPDVLFLVLFISGLLFLGILICFPRKRKGNWVLHINIKLQVGIYG